MFEKSWDIGLHTQNTSPHRYCAQYFPDFSTLNLIDFPNLPAQSTSPVQTMDSTPLHNIVTRTENANTAILKSVLGGWETSVVEWVDQYFETKK